jgi:anti-anti-sigma regulatory factor
LAAFALKISPHPADILLGNYLYQFVVEEKALGSLDGPEVTMASQEEGLLPLAITCEASLDISQAQALQSTLHEALAIHQPVVLETAQVERVDTAILQLLCSFIQEARAQGVAVHWHQPSPALRTAARLLDLTACLDLPADLP